MNQVDTKRMVDTINEQGQQLERYILTSNMQQQVIDQYRRNIYQLELKITLLNKMLEEKGLLAKNELDVRWPIYLKNEVGVLEANGKMAGTLKVTFYGEKI